MRQVPDPSDAMHDIMVELTGPPHAEAEPLADTEGVGEIASHVAPLAVDAREQPPTASGATTDVGEMVNDADVEAQVEAYMKFRGGAVQDGRAFGFTCATEVMSD